MSKKNVVVERPSIAWLAFVAFLILVKWLLIFSWRFFTGNFMDGDKSRNDVTWWRDASPMYRRRRRAWSWWKRKSRMKKAVWRQSFFWPIMLVTAGFLFWSVDGMIVVLLWILPLLGWLGFVKTRSMLFVPMRVIRDGKTSRYWTMKPKYAKRLDRWRPIWERDEPAEPATVEIPQEFKAAVANELREELEGEAVLHLQLLADPEDNESFS